MTPDTPAPTDPVLPPPTLPAGEPLAYSRQLGLALLVAAILMLGGAGYYGYRAYAVNKAKAADAKEVDADKKPPADLTKPTDTSFASYVFNAFSLGMAGLAAAAVGLNRFARLPNPDPTAEAISNRLALLVVGLVVGVLLAFAGLWHFAVNVETLTKWLDGREAAEKWKPLAALLACVGGCGVAFLCALPARGSERADQLSRRLIYGSNVAVAALLLFILLVIGNVIAGAKLPNRLDTTNEGFFSIDPGTATYLRDLDPGMRITAHTMIPESSERESVAARRLLAACAEAAPDRFILKTYPATIAAVNELKAKFPQADTNLVGVILAVGDDQTKYAQIPLADFIKSEGGRGGKQSFNGEAAVMKEVKFLTESGDKAILYVTQGSGEPALMPAGAPGAASGRALTTVKKYLEDQRIEVRPLTFAPGLALPVPADATAVFVADPQGALSPQAVESLRAYYTGTPGGKKGKLIVAAGIGTAAIPTSGLEELLAEAGVRIDPAVLYSRPTRELPPTVCIVESAGEAIAARVGPARAVATTGLLLPDCRPILLPQAMGGGAPPPSAIPVFTTEEGKVTWQEPARAVDPYKTFELMFDPALPREARNDVIRRVKATNSSRVLAAAVTEGTTGRLLVIGSGNFFTDDFNRQTGSKTPTAGTFLATSVDWFRERKEAPSVLSKPYGEYTLPETASGFQLILLPLALAGLAIFAVGGGVWAVRRK